MEITLLSLDNKIIVDIINQQLSDYVSLRLKAGTRAHRPREDHVRIITKESVEWRMPLYLCFIDFAKVFDPIVQSEILKIFECRGIPRKLMKLIRAQYNREISWVKVILLISTMPETYYF